MNRRKRNVLDDRFMSSVPPTDKNEFKKELKEFHLYLVEVSYRPGNPIHLSILATGFKNGNYWELWNNSGGGRSLQHGGWPMYIKVIRPLGSIKERELDV